MNDGHVVDDGHACAVGRIEGSRRLDDGGVDDGVVSTVKQPDLCAGQVVQRVDRAGLRGLLRVCSQRFRIDIATFHARTEGLGHVSRGAVPGAGRNDTHAAEQSRMRDVQLAGHVAAG